MTEDVVAAYAQYPHRIIPFCHVDVTREDAVVELEKKRAASGVFKGYGEQKQHVRLDDPRLARVLAVCDELHWPVTWHFQEGENGYNGGIEHLEVLLKKFPISDSSAMPNRGGRISARTCPHPKKPCTRQAR